MFTKMVRDLYQGFIFDLQKLNKQGLKHHQNLQPALKPLNSESCMIYPRSASPPDRPTIRVKRGVEIHLANIHARQYRACSGATTG